MTTRPADPDEIDPLTWLVCVLLGDPARDAPDDVQMIGPCGDRAAREREDEDRERE